MTHAESSSLRDILVVVFKHLRSILLIFAVSTLAGVAAVMLATPQYTATSKLLVQVGREKTASFATAPQPAANVSLIQRAQDINNEVEILRDPALMAKLLPDIKARLARLAAAHPAQPAGGIKQWISDTLAGAGRSLRQAAEAVGWSSPQLSPDELLLERLLASVDIDFPKDTDVVNVSFRWTDRDFAAYVANALVRVFQEEHVRVHGIENSASFYADQLALSRDHLARVEESLAEFLKDGQISNLDTEKTLALNALADTDKELNQARIALDNVTQKLAATELNYAKSDGWIETLDPELADATLKALDESFVALSTERTQLLGRFFPGYPAVVNIESQLRQLRDAKYTALKARYVARRAEILDRIGSLQAKVKAKKGDLARLGDRTLEYERAVRQRDQLEAETAEYRQKVEDLRIRDDLDARVITSVKVISEAQPPVRPSAPKKRLIVIAAAAAGLFFGLAFAILAEFFNHTFRHEGDIRRVLGIPLLATVPHMTGRPVSPARSSGDGARPIRLPGSPGRRGNGAAPGSFGERI